MLNWWQGVRPLSLAKYGLVIRLSTIQSLLDNLLEFVAMKIYQSLAIIVLLFVSAPIASAQILNGSFEDFSGFTEIALDTELGFAGVGNGGTSTPWVFGMEGGILDGNTTNGNAAAWLSPRSGTDAVVSQTFSFANSGSFSLTWDSFTADSQFSRILSEYRYNVDLSAVGGAAIFNSDFEELRDGVATSHSVPFNVTSGQYTLTFTGLQGDLTGDTFIDNVSVVPEPGSSLLTMLAGLGLFIRRRRNTSES